MIKDEHESFCALEELVCSGEIMSWLPVGRGVRSGVPSTPFSVFKKREDPRMGPEVFL